MRKPITKPVYDPRRIPGRAARFQSLDSQVGGRSAFLRMESVEMEPVRAETENPVEKFNSGLCWQAAGFKTKGKRP